MDQSEIFFVVYDSVVKKLENLTNESKLSNIIKKLNSSYSVSVSDIEQIQSDRGGEKVIVDEKLYNPPSIFGMVITVTVSGQDVGSVLKLYGYIARCLKDDSLIDISGVNWHKNAEKEVILDPFISGVKGDGVGVSDGVCSLDLKYVVSVGVNSQVALEFTRVRERVLKSDVK